MLHNCSKNSIYKITSASVEPSASSMEPISLSQIGSDNTTTVSCGNLCLQCFDAVGWAAGRASGL